MADHINNETAGSGSRRRPPRSSVRTDYLAIVSDVKAGLSRREIASKHDCSEGHITRVFSAYRHAKSGDFEYIIRLRGRECSVADWATQFLPDNAPAPAADGEPAFDRVVAMLRAEYHRALNDKYIRFPIAYALYHVWKEVDSHGEKV